MILKEWAASQGISYRTALNWYHAGKLPQAHKIGGLVLVDDTPQKDPEKTVVYARVSSHDQKDDLDRQASRVSQWVTDQGWSVDHVVTDIGSGLNSNRRKLHRLLADPTVTRIVVEHRDRFSRFGSEYIESVLAASGRELVVMEPDEIDDDLVSDVTDFLTSVCARLYGRRSASRRAVAAMEAAGA